MSPDMKPTAAEEIAIIGPRPPSWLDWSVGYWPLWAILAIIAFALWWYRRRIRLKRHNVVNPEQRLQARKVEPPLDPRVAWNSLLAPTSDDREILVAFCFEVSRLLRYLVSQRWIPGAPHMTTDELTLWIQQQAHDATFSQSLVRVLQQLDCAKYTDSALTVEWVNQLFSAAQELALELMKDTTDASYVAKLASDPSKTW